LWCGARSGHARGRRRGDGAASGRTAARVAAEAGAERPSDASPHAARVERQRPRPSPGSVPGRIVLRRARDLTSKKQGRVSIMTNWKPTAALIGLACLTFMACPGPAASQETIRTGKAVPESIAFIPFDVGVHT